MRTPLMIIIRTVAKIKTKANIKLRKLQTPESFFLTYFLSSRYNLLYRQPLPD